MNFFYEAIDENGNAIVGKIDAGNEQEARRNLMLMGYRPRSLAPNPGSSAPLPVPVVQEAEEEPSLATGHSLTPDLSSAALSMGTSVALTANAGRSAAPQNFTGMHSLGGVQAAAQGAGARSGNITLSGNAARLGNRNVNKTQQRSAAMPGAAPNPNASKLGGVTTSELMLFFQQLASLVKSGMTIYVALDNLAPRTKNANLSKVAREMAEAAHAGRRISDVMEMYPRIFPDHIVGMVRAGELGGFLEIALAEIAQNYEQNIALYRGSWIPKLMASQAFLGLAIVLPVGYLFEHGFDIAAGAKDYLWHEMIILPIFIALYFGFKWLGRYVQLPHLRRWRDAWALRLPPFGDLSRQVALFNFTKMLRKLYHAGVAPIHAWEGAMNTASNVVIREKLADAWIHMQKGSSLADAFTATGLFADNVEQLIITGQHSGEVVESLDRAADIYDERVQEARGKARMAMFRMGILTMMILGGATLAWLMYHELMGQFNIVDKEFNTDGILRFLF